MTDDVMRLNLKNFKAIKIGLILVAVFAQPISAFAANKIQPDIVENVKKIAYGVALVKFCPLLSPPDLLSFNQDQLMAERIVNFEHSSEYKFILKNQDAVANVETEAGWSCNNGTYDKIIEIELIMKRFISTSPLKDELVVSHPQQPKLNQAFIFAGFMQARIAWMYQRKCGILNGVELKQFNDLVLKTQQEIELVFRPEQAQKLNARVNENEYSALIFDCKRAAPFIEHALEIMTEDIPNAIEILKRF